MSSARLVLPLVLALVPAAALAKDSEGHRRGENRSESADNGKQRDREHRGRGERAETPRGRAHAAPSHRAHAHVHVVRAAPRRHRHAPPVVLAPAPVRAVFVEPSRAERRADAPARVQDRAGDLSVGLRGGVYASGFAGEGGYADAGLGLDVRYRLAEPLGFEVQAMVHDPSFGGGADRAHAPVSASVELFAFPWARVSPYALGGLTWTARDVTLDDGKGKTTTIGGATWGPHVGVGLEVALSRDVSLSGDVRWIGYVNTTEADPSARGAMQAAMGVNVYF